jgi:hypothetical protein
MPNARMFSLTRQINEWASWTAGWFRQAEGWQIAAVVVVAIVVLPLMPLLLTLLFLAALALFAKAWLKEFTFLMRLRDDDFPGHNDKLIWAILLIVLAPVGTWLFQNYREAHWPEAKPSKGDAFDAY